MLLPIFIRGAIMPITDEYLVEARQRDEGLQRIYRFPSGNGLSLINASIAHCYPFAWEAAVLTKDGQLDYSTSLTDDVEVFFTDEEANEFIKRAARVL
jgi:hypothetical protein